jgi:peptidoglycan/xylan/chitin deacetylase (PgdA/CDA1 family)
MRGLLLALGVAFAVQVAPARAAAPAVTAYRFLRTNQRLVALTFDDGPSPYTAQVLAVLQRLHVHATFFEMGARVALYPDATRAVLRDGDVLGNHTYTHPNLELETKAGVRDQIRMTQREIRDVARVTPHWFRPPYGAVNEGIVRIAAGLGLRTALWSVDPLDWSDPGTAAIEERVLSRVRPGRVVLLHDGGGWRGETVAALPDIIETLRARGYRFVTLDQMFPPAITPGCPRQACSDAT